MKRHILFMYFLSLLTPVSIMAQEGVNLEKYRVQSSKKWESEVAKLEALDQSEQHPANSILFIGSSSIRKWNDIASDMAPYHPIQRHYGKE